MNKKLWTALTLSALCFGMLTTQVLAKSEQYNNREMLSSQLQNQKRNSENMKRPGELGCPVGTHEVCYDFWACNCERD